jgi:(2Fe-2S) ferredoxin
LIDKPITTIAQEGTMYTDVNFKTKKALKDAVKAGRQIGVYNPGFHAGPPLNGQVSVEGPHAPKPHTWYARVTLEDGVIVKVT